MDADGYYWRTVQQTMVSASAEEVERELRVQINHALRNGMKPTHLTTHLGALFARADLAEVYLRVAREHWIPAVVMELTPELMDRFRGMGYPVPDELVQALEDYSLPKINDLRIVPPTESYDEKVDAVVELIEGLPAGLSQIAFTPATDSPALRALDPEWRQRVWEAEVWRDERVREALDADGVVVTDWREIMRRYEGHEQ